MLLAGVFLQAFLALALLEYARRALHAHRILVVIALLAYELSFERLSHVVARHCVPTAAAC